MIDDIIYILYYKNDFPWNDKKFKKRLNRLIFLNIIYIFDKNQHKSKLNIHDFILFVANKFDSVSGTSGLGMMEKYNVSNLNDIKNTFNNYKINNKFYNLVEVTYKILQNYRISDPYYDPYYKYLEYITNIIMGYAKLLASWYACHLNMNFKDITQIGGSKEKNIKYKYKIKYSYDN